MFIYIYNNNINNVFLKNNDYKCIINYLFSLRRQLQIQATMRPRKHNNAPTDTTQ